MKRLAPVLALALVLSPKAHGHPDETRKIAFPATRLGEVVLAVDPHTHSVFSDGHVWPTVRVWEAERDDLDALMVTEHLEHQPHREDIPHPDRNRSFEIASQEATEEETKTLIINGAEITRGFPPGHINAVFVQDANLLLREGSREAIESAKAQGAFIFWNHSWWTRDFKNGVVEIHDMHKKLIRDGLLDGIEIANGAWYSNEAFQIALDFNLGIIGVSDIHGLIDYDYDIGGGAHRTVTLVIASERTEVAIKRGFYEHRTIALYRHTLYGREREVMDILEGALTLEKGDSTAEGKTVLTVTLRNGSSTPFTLINTGPRGLSRAGNVITVPARGELAFGVNDVDRPDDLELEFEVVNAFIKPRKHAQLRLR